MATSARLTESLMVDTLMNYLVSMARTVESAMNRALDAIVSLDHPRTAALPGEVFLLEPRINEMEIVIDEHAIRLLRRGSFTDVCALQVVRPYPVKVVAQTAYDSKVGNAQDLGNKHADYK